MFKHLIGLTGQLDKRSICPIILRCKRSEYYTCILQEIYSGYIIQLKRSIFKNYLFYLLTPTAVFNSRWPLYPLIPYNMTPYRHTIVQLLYIIQIQHATDVQYVLNYINCTLITLVMSRLLKPA